jgi:hypothetical protein
MTKVLFMFLFTMFNIFSSENSHIIYSLSDLDEYFEDNKITLISRYEDINIVRYAMLLYNPKKNYENVVSIYDKKNDQWSNSRFEKINDQDNLTITHFKDDYIVQEMISIFEVINNQNLSE